RTRRTSPGKTVRQSMAGCALLPAAMSALCAIELPQIRNPLQGMCPEVFEVDARSGDQIPNGPRNQHIACAGKGGDARSNMYGNAMHIVVYEFDLSGMNANADRNAEVLQCACHRERAMNCARRSVKGRKKSIAETFHFSAPEAHKFLTYGFVVCIQQVPPMPVAKRTGALRRSDDVRENDRRQHPVNCRSRF